jgi:hypothetical protein
MSELAKAVIAVMKAVKNIDKSMTVGTGGSSYKGVADKDVKYVIGQAMAENGLCILPIGIESSVNVERWLEDTSYGPKQKQQVFNEVTTKYMLLHESGESQIIVGSGHGVDSMDKAAGKATTYALKYALLYTFMVPTGSIDDADVTHSNAHATPAKLKLEVGTEKYNTIMAWVVTKKDKGLLWIISEIKSKYEVTEEIQSKIEDAISKK